MKIVAVTSCPTGIAHTFMAAESLEQAAMDAGHEIKVETQGAAGGEELTAAEIADADAVVFAADVPVRDRERFAGKPVVEVPVKRAINDGPGLISQAENAARSYVPAAGAAAAAAPPPPAPAEQPHFGIKLRQWLMTGVSYMIPFVAAGGILIALGFLLGGAEVATKVYGGTFHGVEYKGVVDGSGSLLDPAHPGKLIEAAGYAGLIFWIGKIAFSMLVPILSGFIAYGMAGRVALVAGIVTGLLADRIGAGFLGGVVGGLLAGAVVMWLSRIKVPRGVAGVMPVVVIPLVSALVMGVVMVVVIGEPVAAAQRGLTDWLQGLSGANAVVLGLLLGLMMAFDMGGPVNKTAYVFGVASIASGKPEIMAAVMAAGITPPIAMALATVVRKNLFTRAERQAGEAAWLLGASFITEGAIPFAAADPLRVIPSLMAGSAVTGALTMAFGATSPAPHGGIWVILLIGKPVLWIIAILAGILVSTACVVAAKSLGPSDAEVAAGAPAAATR